ncbi:hypothetical protein ACP70R_009236 [Stipagrostis hirtigluma subsp. patula]
MSSSSGSSSSGGSSSGSESSSSDEEPTSQLSRRKPRTEAKWPTDKIIVTEITKGGQPMDKKALQRLRKLAGLVGRQRISLTVEHIKDVDAVQRAKMFDTYIQPRLEFAPEMKETAIKAAWVKISKARRVFRSNLVTKFLAKGIQPFAHYQFLEEADWKVFINQKSTQEAVEKSLKGKELRSKDKHNHNLGPTGYKGAIPKWLKEDAKLEAEGKPNPWKQYPGRTQPYLRARGKLTEDGEISFNSNEIQQVSHKVLEKVSESSEGSVTGVREHDILTEALGNPEHRGRVRGVSSDSGWRSWPECEDMYRKRKKSRVVDVEMFEETLEQRLAREREQMHQQFMALLAAHGVATIPEISPLKRRSSQSSVGLHELHAQASALHLPDGDTIDGLDEPTPCILQIVRGDVRYNVARGQVFPDETVLHTVQVDRRFHAVVMVDWVDDEYCDQPLPIPNDEIPTLRDALWQRILWDRLHIICRKSELPPPPQRQISRVPSPPSQNKKEKQKEEKKEEKEKEKEKEREKGQKEKEKEKDKEKEKKEQGKEKEKEKEKGKGKEKEKEKEKEKGKTRKDSKKSKKSKSNEVAPVWTSANPNFKMGEPILPQDELRALGGQAYALHQYYMKCCEEKKRNSITLCVSKDEFRKGCTDYVCVNFSDLYDLYHHSGMDISLLRVHTLSLIKQSKMDKLPVGFLDPSAMSTSQLNASGSDVFEYLVKALSHFIATKKHYVMFAYNTISKEGSSHWVLVVIVLPLNQVWYLDSLRHVKRDYTNLGKVIDQAFAKVQFHHKMKKQQLTHVTDFECHQQQANDACGFYCCHHMSSILQQSDKKKPEEIKFTSAPLTSGDLNIVTQEVAICLTVGTLSTRGDFHCPVN